MKLFTILLSVVFHFIVFLAISQPFEVDESFGENGEAVLQRSVIAQSIIIRTNNNIVLLNNGPQLVQFTKEGNLDVDFGIEGKATAGILENSYTRDFTIQPDEKIVIVGYLKDSIGNRNIFLVRFLGNGILDESFGNGGITVIDNLEFGSVANSVAIQKDSKIIVVGQRRNFKDNEIVQENDFILFRFNDDGSLDKEFGNQGWVTTDFGNKSELFEAVILQDDGKIVASGITKNRETNFDFVMIRYSNYGIIDTTFGINGKIIMDFGGGYDRLDFMEIQADGKILLAGTAPNRIKDDIALVRYNKNGILDTSFGNNGKVLTDLSGSNNVVFQSHDHITSFLLRSDNKILVSGHTFVSNQRNSETFFVQYDENGFLDNDFGDKGVFITGSWDSLRFDAIARQSDGNIIALGGRNFSTGATYFLTRYLTSLNVGNLNFFLNNNSTLIYPNPIQQTATLKYTLEKPETLTIQLLDLNGRVLKTYLQNELQKAGEYQQEIDMPNGLAKGIYYLRLASPKGQMTVKVVK